jgi:hypothetical protein
MERNGKGYYHGRRGTAGHKNSWSSHDITSREPGVIGHRRSFADNLRHYDMMLRV